MKAFQDLTSTRELDGAELKAVKGGMGRRPSVSFLDSIDYDFSEIVNIQNATTLQSNTLAQSADVFSNVGGKGNLVRIDGGSNYASQLNASINHNG